MHTVRAVTCATTALVIALLLRLRRIALHVLFVGTVLAFISGFVSIFWCPSKLPLPWSDMNDFVADPQGNVYIHLCFYNRILKYDKAGSFLVSYPAPEKATLAINCSGSRLYVMDYGRCEVISLPGGELVETVTGGNSDWVEGREEHPQVIPESGLPEQPGAVAPGERLSHHGERTVFACVDGSVLRRNGTSIEKSRPGAGSPDLVYRTEWLLALFVFPWPAGLTWILMVLYAAVPHREATTRRP